MAAPSERTGLKVLATWAGSASTVTFWARAAFPAYNAAAIKKDAERKRPFRRDNLMMAPLSAVKRCPAVKEKPRSAYTGLFFKNENGEDHFCSRRQSGRIGHESSKPPLTGVHRPCYRHMFALHCAPVLWAGKPLSGPPLRIGSNSLGDSSCLP